MPSTRSFDPKFSTKRTMMSTLPLRFKIKFHSYWHCGSGLSSGMDKDSQVYKKDGFPIIPGKTIKGLLLDSYQILEKMGCEFSNAFNANYIFGTGGFNIEDEKIDSTAVKSKYHFSNAELPLSTRNKISAAQIPYLYSSRSSTKIDPANGVAASQTLRKIEVTIPLTLYGKIENLPISVHDDMEMILSFTKKLGVNRTRGLGRCQFSKL